MPQMIIEKINKIFERFFRRKNNVNENKNEKQSVMKRIVGLKSKYFPIINPKINGITTLKAGFVFREFSQVM